MSVNEKMKTIADAIRAHTGGKDALTLDAMAEAIAGIQAGGGSVAFSQGTVTLAEEIVLQNHPVSGSSEPSFAVKHDLGVKPDLFVLAIKDETHIQNCVEIFVYTSGVLNTDGQPSFYVYVFSDNNSASTWRQGKSEQWGNNNWSVTGETMPIPQVSLSSQNKKLAATEHRWLAIGGVSV